MILFSLLLLSLSARAEQMLEDIDPVTFSKTNVHDTNDYMGYKTGDHYEWTLYGLRYDKPDYGHRYEWSKPGFSKMSICQEVDSETGGERYHALADDAHCPVIDTEYRWDVAFEGQPSYCLRVDRVTHGQRFSRIVDEHRCAKPATDFVWERGNCSEVDRDTSGKVFRKGAADYLCSKTIDNVVAYGRKLPTVPRVFSEPKRAPASAAAPALEFDPAFREEPEDLEDSVDHVHRSADKIHRR